MFYVQSFLKIFNLEDTPSMKIVKPVLQHVVVYSSDTTIQYFSRSYKVVKHENIWVYKTVDDMHYFINATN